MLPLMMGYAFLALCLMLKLFLRKRADNTRRATRVSRQGPVPANPRLVENFNRYLFTVKEGFFTRLRFKEK